MLANWQYITEDYRFDPQKSGSQENDAFNEQRNLAMAMLGKVGDYATPQEQKEWQQLAKTSPNEVIENCNQILERVDAAREERYHDARCEIASRKFISLCEQLKTLGRKDPQASNIENSLKQLTATYLEDKVFIEKVMASDSKSAVERISQEQRSRERTNVKAHEYSLEH